MTGKQKQPRKERSSKTFHRDLDPELIVSIYRQQIEDNGKASCATVAEELANCGVKTRTGRPPTRAGVHYVMKRHKDGPELLAYTLKRTGKLRR